MLPMPWIVTRSAMLSSPSSLNNQRVDAKRERVYNYLGNPPTALFAYNAGGNSFSISPIRLTGGTEDRVPCRVNPVLSPPGGMNASMPAAGPDWKDLDCDFAQGQPKPSSRRKEFSGSPRRNDPPAVDLSSPGRISAAMP